MYGIRKKQTRAAVSELRLDYEIEHVTDFAEIAGYGVMTTPALVFNGEVISYGKVLTVEEVKALLSKKIKQRKAGNLFMKKPELLSDKAGEASGYDLQQKVKILKKNLKRFV